MEQPAVNPQPSSDERIMAALAHGSILLSSMGTILAAVIWVTQTDKSRYFRSALRLVRTELFGRGGVSD
jgi:PhoPQ-activated pathogenicity-related protein